MNQIPTVLVIGAGLGGIVTAARLARCGFQVTVLEKCERAGGRCDRLTIDGHHFDTGPTLYLMPEIFAQAFAELGERLEDHLDVRRVDPSYHIQFDDSTNLVLSSDLNVMQKQLDAIEPGSFGGFLRYLSEGQANYDLVLSRIAGRNFRNLLEYFSPRNIPLILRLKALSKHYDNVGNYFDDHRLKIAFSFQDMYVGLSPYEAPASYSLLQYAEFAGGVWFPTGGMYRIVEAMTTIAENNGVQFMYNSPVEQIDVDERQATGVTLSCGRRMQADVVVANADLPYVYRHLLPDDGTAKRLERKKYTCSTVTFFWGVDKEYPQLGPHNLFLVKELRQSLKCIFQELDLPAEPCFYVHAPARIDPALAPVSQDTLTVVVPVGHINDTAPQNWGVIQKRARHSVLQRLARIGMTDLAEHIKFERSFTPRDWQSRYNLVKGASYGLSHNFLQMGYLRPRNQHYRYRNLYFVGASTHPGAGLPTVLLSARLTTERVLQGADVPRPASGYRVSSLTPRQSTTTGSGAQY